MQAQFVFLGSGGSMGVPVIGCSCSVCTSKSAFDKRMRPSGLIRRGDDAWLIDAGPDFRAQALKFKINRLNGVLLTHSHYDHIGGLDDLRIYFFKQNKNLPCLLSQETLDELKVRCHYLLQPNQPDKTASAQFDFTVLPTDFGQVQWEGLNLRYVSYFQGDMKVTGFRLGNFAYISDIRTFTPEVIDPLKGIDILVISALRFKASTVHFSVDEAIDFARKVGAKKTYFTHIAHDLDHEKTNAMLPEDVKLGYDGFGATYTPMNEFAELSKVKTAVLIAVYYGGKKKEECDEYLKELERLCETYGIQAVAKFPCSIKQIDAGMYVGSGKLQEILDSFAEHNAELVIFDDEISPYQQRNLEKFFKKPVIDRTELIIEIFAQRAQTKEAKLQVELAKIKYQFPRLKRLWTHLSRQSSSGGAHVKGEGEKQIEIDKQLLKVKVNRLNSEIKEVRSQRTTQRTARLRSGIPTFAIVGYTNAGKSTLLKALTQADVLVEDKLFATLDTKARKYILPNNQEILLVDTVGFIRKIPTTLVEAFKSTLEEAAHTDILLHLIDVSHPQAEEQAEETMRILKELKALDRPIITVFNKIDQCENPMIMHRLRLKYPKTVQISALNKTGFDELIEMMIKEISALRKTVKLCIPQSDYALVSELMREGRVISLEYEGDDVHMFVEIPSILEYKVKPFVMA